MNIKESIIEYKTNSTPYHTELCSITRTIPHYHKKELELVFCLEGYVDLVAGHQRVRVNAGQVFSIDHSDIHYIHSDIDNLTLLVHLDLTKLHIPWKKLYYIYFSCESIHCYPYQKNAMSEIKDILFSLAYAEHTSDRYFTSTANRLIDIMLKYFNWFNYENQTDHMNEDIHDRFYRILAYCSKHYNKKISISQIAEKEHINSNYFSQFIKNTVFKSFSNLINYVRCYEAEHLLLTTEMPNTEISYACGFSDPKYFYSAFKFWWEQTPAGHRASYRQYMKLPTSVIYIDNDTACKKLKHHIAKWHLEKNLSL